MFDLTRVSGSIFVQHINRCFRFIFDRFGAPALLVFLLVPSLSISQIKEPIYPNAAALARACIGEDGDVSLIAEKLRKDGWQELATGRIVPENREVGIELSPDVLTIVRNGSTFFLLSGGENDLTEARRDMSHEGSHVFTFPFGGRNGLTFFKQDVGLFAISPSDAGKESTRVSCEFVGPWHPEDDRVRWLLPGENIPGGPNHLKRIYGPDNQIGPYAGAFIKMNPEGFETMFGVKFPPLTILSIRANIQVSG